MLCASYRRLVDSQLLWGHWSSLEEFLGGAVIEAVTTCQWLLHCECSKLQSLFVLAVPLKAFIGEENILLFLLLFRSILVCFTPTIHPLFSSRCPFNSTQCDWFVVEPTFEVRKSSRSLKLMKSNIGFWSIRFQRHFAMSSTRTRILCCDRKW